MGKAAIDLPDPLQHSPEANVGAADDLLDQLVGDQIDRFLTDKEAAERAEQPGNAANATSGVGVLALYTPPATVPLADLSSKLTSVFSQVEMTVAELKWSEPAASPIGREVVDPFEDSTSLAERNGLADLWALKIPVPSARVNDAHEDVTETIDLPAYLRPLAWLNAPLARCSESGRQTVGKIAILALINSVALLMYVMFFR